MLAVAGLFASPFVGASVAKHFDERKIRERLAADASVPTPAINSDKDLQIDRTAERKRLHDAVFAESSSYRLLHGPYAQGKTTLVLQTLQEERNTARIYVGVPETGNMTDLVLTLGKALNYNPNDWFRGNPIHTLFVGVSKEQRDPPGTWTPYEEKLVELAEELKAAGKPSPVVVIDNINILASRDPDALTTLRNFAKEMADDRLIRVAFITSDGKALKMMTGGNDSRCKPVEISDISLDDAKALLLREARQMYKLPAEPAGVLLSDGTAATSGHNKQPSKMDIDTMAELIVRKYTGGRVGLVFVATEEIRDLLKQNASTPPEQMLAAVALKVESRGIRNASKFYTTEAQKLMIAIFKKHAQLPAEQQRDIVANARLTQEEAMLALGKDDEVLAELDLDKRIDMLVGLCDGNMFWQHPGDRSITFQSAYAATLAERLPKVKAELK